MKTIMYFSSLLLSIYFLGSANAVPGDGRIVNNENKTLSPYFFVQSDDPEVDKLPLKSTTAQVNIAGVMADVRVSQEYRNEGARTIEAIYVFPGSTRAAVFGMKMTIGERTIEAKIDKKEEAKRLYEAAKSQGKTASLLEQHRPNVFSMNVANILPGDVIKVELRYSELLVPTDSVYEFVYPTVVGPRYSSEPSSSAPASERWVENPYLHEGDPPHYTFDLQASISAGMPISEVTSSSHKVNVRYDGKTRAVVSLNPKEKFGGNRDYILKYRLAVGGVETGLVMYEGEEENFFLLMVQPPKRVSAKHIPGREYIFIVDVSGSMYGYPLDISKKLLSDLIGNLRPTDMFNVMLFAGTSSVLSEKSLKANVDNIKRAIKFIDKRKGGGGTELLSALKRALALPQEDGFSRTVVIATDGYVTVGKEAFDLIRNKLGDANFFPFGIGTGVNRFIIEGMARAGMGEPFIVTNRDEAPKNAEQFRKYIQSPVLTNVKVQFDGFKTYDVEPPAIPDVLADRPVVVFGKWRGNPRGEIVVSGVSGNGAFNKAVRVQNFAPDNSNSALRYLWARHKLSVMSDYRKVSGDPELVTAITGIGLKYNLLTEFTSFVAIDTEVRVEDGEAVVVKQPLPLPQGVSDKAVGRHSFAARGMQYKKAATPALSPVENRPRTNIDKRGMVVQEEMALRSETDTFGLFEDKSADSVSGGAGNMAPASAPVGGADTAVRAKGVHEGVNEERKPGNEAGKSTMYKAQVGDRFVERGDSTSPALSGSNGPVSTTAPNAQFEVKSGEMVYQPVREIHVKLGDVTITGTLEGTNAVSVLNKRLNDIEDICYSKEALKDYLLKGTIKIKLTVDTKGNVIRVKILETGLKVRYIESCLIETAKKWKFLGSKKGGMITVSYLF